MSFGFTTLSAMQIVMEIGVGLLLWAALALWTATRPRLARAWVFAIIEGNLLWVVATIVLLVGSWLPFSTTGQWALAIVADVVGLFAFLQYVGWRQLAKLA